MKISELKETVRTVIRERSINAIAKLQQKNIEDISKALEFYKKNKHTDKKEAFIKVLKKLGNEKLKLAGELDLKVSGMYKDAEYKGEGIEEGENGLWDNIRKKKARGGKPAHKNSKAHKDAVKAGDKIKANESVNERNITRSTERVLQKGIQSILGTSVNQEMNDNGAYEFFVDYAEFVIGVGEDETKKAKYAFSIYDDGARKYLAKGKSNDEKDLIKQILSSVKKFKNKLLLTTESVNESKKPQGPVNRWLAIKNDETKHPHKKMAMGLKELKYQLGETQKFFTWYNQIKSMNELDSSDYWKRTNKHIYKIKERLINIAKTIQEIEK